MIKSLYKSCEFILFDRLFELKVRILTPKIQKTEMTLSP